MALSEALALGLFFAQLENTRKVHFLYIVLKISKLVSYIKLNCYYFIYLFLM